MYGGVKEGASYVVYRNAPAVSNRLEQDLSFIDGPFTLLLLNAWAPSR